MAIIAELADAQLRWINREAHFADLLPAPVPAVEQPPGFLKRADGSQAGGTKASRENQFPMDKAVIFGDHFDREGGPHNRIETPVIGG